MTTRLSFIVLFFVSVVLIIISGCATEERTIYKASKKELVGIWINTDYNDFTGKKAKYIILSDLSITMYNKDFDQKPYGDRAIFTIEERWVDSEGNIWYKGIWSGGAFRYYTLIKLSDSGRIFEETGNRIDYPDEINPSHWSYRIYYRQE